MTDIDPKYVATYIQRQPWRHRVILRLFRKPIRKLAAYCAHVAYQRGKMKSAEMHEVIGVLDAIYPSPTKRFHKTPWGWDVRCFGGFLVVNTRERFLVWWSTDATPPTKRERNGRWLIGSYGKWAHLKTS